MSPDEFDRVCGVAEQRRRGTASSGRAPVSGSVSRRRRGLMRALVAIIVVFAVSRAPRLETSGIPLPTTLAGVWVAETAPHAGRTLELTPDSVILGQADGARAAHALRLVLERDDALPRIYEVRYHSDVGSQSMELHLHYDQTLRLRHPADVVWRRR